MSRTDIPVCPFDIGLRFPEHDDIGLRFLEFDDFMLGPRTSRPHLHAREQAS